MLDWFKKLFGVKDKASKPSLPIPPPDPSAIAGVLARSRKAVYLDESDRETQTYTGGLPNLGRGFVWPAKDGKPLEFLGQVSLDEIAQLLPESPLPKTGVLSFFYAMDDDQAWGFDPKDVASWKVIYSEAADSTQLPAGVIDIPRLNLKGRVGDSFASSTHEVYKGIAGLETLEPHWYEIVPEIEASELQILGYALPIQNDMMEEECAMASAGIYCGDGSSWNLPEAIEARAKASEWVLLAQFNSRDSQEILFGDTGMLYFFISKANLENADFAKTWISLQCF